MRRATIAVLCAAWFVAGAEIPSRSTAFSNMMFLKLVADARSEGTTTVDLPKVKRDAPIQPDPTHSSTRHSIQMGTGHLKGTRGIKKHARNSKIRAGSSSSRIAASFANCTTESQRQPSARLRKDKLPAAHALSARVTRSMAAKANCTHTTAETATLVALTPVDSGADTVTLAPSEPFNAPTSAADIHELPQMSGTYRIATLDDTLALRRAIVECDLNAVIDLGDTFGSDIFDLKSVVLASIEPTGFIYSEAFVRNFPSFQPEASMLLRISMNKMMHDGDWLLEMDSIPAVQNAVLNNPGTWDDVLHISGASSERRTTIFMHMLEMIDDRENIDLSIVAARAWLRGNKRTYDAIASRTDWAIQMGRALPHIARFAPLSRFAAYCTTFAIPQVVFLHSLANLAASDMCVNEQRVLLFLAFCGVLDIRQPSMSALSQKVQGCSRLLYTLLLSATRQSSVESAIMRTDLILPEVPLF